MVTNSLSFVSQLSIVQLAHYQSMILLNDKYAGKKLENRLPAQQGIAGQLYAEMTMVYSNKLY